MPGGILSDRIGSGNVLVASCLISAVITGVIVVTDSLVWLFVITVLLGFSTGWYGVTFLSLLSDIYPERGGTAIGVTLAGGNIGNSALPSTMVVVAGIFTWCVGFGMLVLPFLLLAVIFWIVILRSEANRSSALDSASLESFRYVWRGVTERTVLLFLVLQILMVFTYHGFMGMYPTYLIDIKGLSVEIATVLFGLFFALAIHDLSKAKLLVDSFGYRTALSRLGLSGQVEYSGRNHIER